jgi:Kef-type K+ transport system membrane component KefB
VIGLLLVLALGGLMHAARTFGGVGSGAGTELAFGYLLLTAYFTAKVTSRIGLPRLTGYLIAGMITGPYLLELVDHDLTARLTLVKGTAVCMIGLTAGTGLAWARVRAQLGPILRVSIIAVIGTAAVIAGAVFALRPQLPFLAELPDPTAIALAAVIGATLSAKSPAVVLALIDETGSEGEVTDLMLASVVVGDLLTIVLFAIAAAICSATAGGEVDMVATAVSLGWGIGGSSALGILLGLLIGVFVRKVERGHALFATMICVVVATIAPTLRIDPLITMIAAGVALENISRADASVMLRTFDTAALPTYLVFFAVAGAEVHLDEVVALIVPVVILFVVRAGGFFVFGRIGTAGHPNPAARGAVWVGLLPQAGLALALALLLTQSLGPLGERAAGLVFGLVAFNEMIAPIILRVVMLRTGEAGRRRPPTGGGGH